MEAPYLVSGINPNAILSDLQYVKGMDGARAAMTRPNSRGTWFDSEIDAFYIITTDANNVKTSIERFKYEKFPEPKPEDIFVSKDEFNTMKGKIDNVEHSIQELTAAIIAATGSPITTQPRANGNNEKSVSNSKGKCKPDAAPAAASGTDSRNEGNN